MHHTCMHDDYDDHDDKRWMGLMGQVRKRGKRKGIEDSEFVLIRN